MTSCIFIHNSEQQYFKGSHLFLSNQLLKPSPYQPDYILLIPNQFKYQREKYYVSLLFELERSGVCLIIKRHAKRMPSMQRKRKVTIEPNGKKHLARGVCVKASCLDNARNFPSIRMKVEKLSNGFWCRYFNNIPFQSGH